MWHLLLVDDDPKSQELVVRACGSSATVLRAVDAAQAERTLEERVIDLIVLEHHLKDRSGLDLLAAIKARRPRLPVIMATAYGSEAVCASAFKLGLRDYFIKPWVVSEMAITIRAVLEAIRRKSEVRQNVVYRPPTRVGEGERQIEASIRRTAQFIRDHISELPLAGQVAGEIGISRFALSRAFRKVMNISYRRYVVECRIARAKELVCRPEYTLTEIAQMVGFSDLPRFDKVFKALVGSPPSTYRRNRRQISARKY